MKTLLKRQQTGFGFTLVEVTLAMGICATVMIAILGLIPASMDQMRTARNLTTMSRISEQIVNDVQLMKWADMERLDGQILNYDEEGTKLENADSFNHMYTVQIDVEKRGVTMPGNGKTPNEFTKRINIHIGESKGKKIDLLALNNPRVKHFSSIISRMDEQKKRK